MFIGDRGTGVGSRLKGHLKYGGKWKPKLHAVSSAIHFTNEHKTSQTCMFCFGPLTHPKRTSKDKPAKKTVNGAFWCLNPRCISVRSHKPIQSRDKTSALAIVVSGLSNLIFNEPLPVFNPKLSQSYTDIFTKTNAFCSRNEHRDGSGAASAEA